MFFRSERLFLRPAWPEDWSDALGALAGDAFVERLERTPWVPRADGPRAPRFLVTLPGIDAGIANLIGCIGLYRRGDEVRLGTWIAPAYRRRGYGTEAARAVLTMGRTLGHRQIHAASLADQPASGRMLERLGFVPTGRVEPCFWPDHDAELPGEVYALTLGQPSDCDGSGSTRHRAA